MIAKPISDLEKKLVSLIKESNKRRKKAKKTRVKHYFEGQGDAFEQVLIELKNLKYELETGDDEEEKQAGEKREQEDAEGESVEGLLQQTLEKGIISQKSSHYYYDGFPNGRIQGRDKVLAAISEPELYEKIQKELDES